MRVKLVSYGVGISKVRNLSINNSYEMIDLITFLQNELKKDKVKKIEIKKVEV
jgi:hypothetical protein